MKKISAVIFDCDGVMFDSRQANINYYNHMLAHFDLPPMSEDEADYVHMNTADASVRHIFRKTPHMEEALAYKKGVDYTPFIKDMIIEPGLKGLLEKLKPDYGLAVATNRSNTIGNVLKRNGLDGYFDIVVSSLDVKNPKPHPESIFKILDFFGIEPAESIYIGDSPVDDLTAGAAGVPFTAYRNRSLEADYYVDFLRDMPGIIDAYNHAQNLSQT